MKQKDDNKTRDMLRTKNAERQDAFKQRQRERGLVERRLWIVAADFEQGKAKGELGGDYWPPHGFSGDIESYLIGWAVGSGKGLAATIRAKLPDHR